ncbi:polyprenyl synthetase family protein [Catelliglobosispora koreensis]|uniref:polyprenyl synthetase family protein n=1 Tax=Catelliglobosispora koreensis TaxID=129052 RepID=UPI000368E629|nr:polyprenyl synthetase family protein [Catelliglobosispora koreensis]
MTDLAAALLLERGREVTEPALRRATDSLPGSIRHIAGYHFGWWDKFGNPSVTSNGKALRPTLVLLAAEAAGGSAAVATPAAVAVELVHNFSLIHDDVMDGDETRRHRPTVWKVFGPGPAILAGDALLTLAFDVLALSGHPRVAEASKVLNAAVVELIEGQAEDLAFEERERVSLKECFQMARHKTAALLECSATLGAIFGGASLEVAASLRAFAGDLGLAFQVVDDLLGIWGDPASTGKPVHSDLRSRKKSLPVVAAMTSGTEAGRKLAAAYGGDEDAAVLAGLVEAAGARDWCLAQADVLTDRALSALPRDPAFRALAELARLMTARDH